MKNWQKFCLIVLSILLVSAVLAPLLFQILPFKFERIFNRLVMIFSILSAVLFVRVSKNTFSSYGFGWNAQSGKLLALGFFSGVAVLVMAIGLRMFFDQAVWSVRSYPAAEWALKAVKIIGAAFLIGVIEEFFFRGFVYQAAQKKWRSTILAFILTNMFYSSVHFISVKKIYIGAEPRFVDSLKLIAAPFMSFLHWELIWPGFIGLFLFGCILNYLVVRTGSLMPAIGLHSGCVFMVKSDGLFVDFLSNNLLFGSGKIYDGVAGWCFLGLLWLFYWILFRKPNSSFNSKDTLCLKKA